MYNRFAENYDRFVDWPVRLALEIPFLQQQLIAVGAHRVLDVACGTGQHALALAEKGFEAVGADLSEKMVEQARRHAAERQLDVPFVVAGFDAVLCLGNSLPHVLTATDLSQALQDFRACLRPGGLLLIQNRNFDAVLARRERWMEPQAYQEDGSEWVFIRFYDFDADGRLTFHILTLQRRSRGVWDQQVDSTRLWPQQEAELRSALAQAGFVELKSWGDLQGTAFDASSSPNLVLTARKPGNTPC